MQLDPGTIIAGKYQLEGLLASGGMGEVWAAYHHQLDTRVAIKFMVEKLASSASARARFEQEAKAAAALRSPHVVQVHDFGVQGDTPYMVLELLEGQDLRSRISQYGRLGLDEAQSVLTQACKALRLAAEAGIVHRDLKPSNIFLAQVGGEEIVKILDFGVAKALRAPVAEGTATGTLLGSPHYMSPEQARGGKLDHRSDLFSLAVILFHMVTGHKPFPGKELGDVLVKICSDPLPVATELNPGLPESANGFFRKALARVPAERFQSAEAMAYEFAALVARHFGLPEPAGDVLHSQSLHHTPSLGASQPPPVGSDGPQPASAAQATLPDLTATQPPEHWNLSGVAPTDAAPLESVKQESTLTLATGSLAKLRELRRRGRWTSVGAALAGAVVAGALVYGLTRSSIETTAPARGPEPELSASAAGPAPVAPAPSPIEQATTTELAQPTSATASATTSVSASAPPPEPPQRPPRSPRSRDSTHDRHPVLGI